MTTRNGVKLSLKVLGLEGMMGSVLVASNEYAVFTLSLIKYSLDPGDMKRIYNELQRQKLIQIVKEDPTSFRISLTTNGIYRLLKLNVDELTIKPMKLWDHHWRMVSFDIPKGRDKERLFFYRRLNELGFTMLNRSMWIHPYDCFEVIKKVTDYCNLTRYITTFEIVKLDVQATQKLVKIYQLS